MTWAGSPASPPPISTAGWNITRRVSSSSSPRTRASTRELIAELEQHDPRIFLFAPTGPSAAPNSVVVNTHTLQPGEERLIGAALRETLAERLAQRQAGV